MFWWRSFNFVPEDQCQNGLNAWQECGFIQGFNPKQIKKNKTSEACISGEMLQFISQELARTPPHKNNLLKGCDA